MPIFSNNKISSRFAAGFLVAGSMLLVQPVKAVTLKIASLSPEGTTWMKKMRAGAGEIKQRTNGRVAFKFYPGGIMGDDMSVLRKIRIGQLHGGAVTGGSLARQVPEMLVYNTPFAFRSFEEVDLVRAQLDKELVYKLERKHFISFGMAEGGFAYLMADKPIYSADDLAGQKVWAPAGDDISNSVFLEGGVTPVTLPVSDVLTGLQTGLINTVSAPPIGVIALQWHTRVQYITHLPLMYIYATMVVSKKAFNKISVADRKIVYEVMRKVYRDLDNSNRKDNIEAMSALKSQGIKFVELDKKESRRWYEIAERATQKLIKSGRLNKKMHDKMQSILMDARAGK